MQQWTIAQKTYRVRYWICASLLICTMLPAQPASSGIRVRSSDDLHDNSPGQELRLSADIARLLLSIQSDREDLEFRWRLSDPVEPESRETGSVLYVKPAESEGKAAVLTLVVTTKERGQDAAAGAQALPSDVTPVLCPPVHHDMEGLHRLLSQHLDAYKRVKEQEQHAALPGEAILPAIEAIICDLTAVETLLRQDVGRTSDGKELRLRIQQTQETRKRYEKERLERLRHYRK